MSTGTICTPSHARLLSVPVTILECFIMLRLKYLRLQAPLGSSEGQGTGTGAQVRCAQKATVVLTEDQSPCLALPWEHERSRPR